MRSLCKINVLFVLALILITTTSWAGSLVGKVTSFTGEVLIISGIKVMQVSNVNQLVNSGDKLQTQQGTVTVTFNDEAFLTVSPFSTAMVQERHEEKGFLIFKKKVIKEMTFTQNLNWLF